MYKSRIKITRSLATETAFRIGVSSSGSSRFSVGMNSFYPSMRSRSASLRRLRFERISGPIRVRPSERKASGRHPSSSPLRCLPAPSPSEDSEDRVCTLIVRRRLSRSRSRTRTTSFTASCVCAASAEGFSRWFPPALVRRTLTPPLL